ncbi:hypothetical protein, partial [Enterobacter hormaechei]
MVIIRFLIFFVLVVGWVYSLVFVGGVVFPIQRVLVMGGLVWAAVPPHPATGHFYRRRNSRNAFAVT